MFKYTKHSLKKLEALFEELDYTIRYEKGNFQSGYCIVENRRVAVINKFFDTEARINCLIDILGQVDLDGVALSDKSTALLRDINRLGNKEEAEKSSKSS